MVDVQQERMQIFEEKLQKKEYSECIETATKLLDSLKTMDQMEAAKIKIACYLAIGDAYLGLKQFQDAVNYFDKARKLSEDKYGLLSDEAMIPIFRLEKALKAWTSLEGGGDAKNILLTSVLLTAQSSEAASKIEPGKHARTLQGLWAVALDKQIMRESNPFVVLYQTVVQKLTSSRLEEFLARTSIVVSSTGLFGMLVYGVFWWLTHPYPVEQYKIPHGDFRTLNAQHCKAKGQKWPFKTFDSNATLSWSQDGNGEISGTDIADRTKLPVAVYDGTPGSLATVFIVTYSANNLLLRWNGYAMQDQYATTYFDATEPENAVASKMYSLRSNTQDFFKRHGRYPGPNERGDLSYTNPFTKRGEGIRCFAAKENVGDLAAACKAQGISPHAGMIVCFTSGPRRYLIGGFDRAKNPIQTGAPNGFINIVPNQKSVSEELTDKIRGMIVFEKPIDQLIFLICAHTAFTGILFVLVLGAVGPALFLATRNWKTATRSKKPPARTVPMETSKK
ncbi:MAG: hypothetical protein JST44_13265 [Cyanobacteria bacterium SZAS LIN-5]|nr:hypothetical protein [Cyanobacteria bacterium SZAS LIN-5]